MFPLLLGLFIYTSMIYQGFYLLYFSASLHIEYPMLFQLKNPSAEKVTHCGVLEFISDEGIIYIPYWVCDFALLCFSYFLKIFCLMNFLTFIYSLYFPLFLLSDDGKYASPRRRHCKCEKHEPRKRNICEAAASHKGFFGYIQSKSHVSIIL